MWIWRFQGFDGFNKHVWVDGQVTNVLGSWREWAALVRSSQILLPNYLLGWRRMEVVYGWVDAWVGGLSSGREGFQADRRPDGLERVCVWIREAPDMSCEPRCNTIPILFCDGRCLRSQQADMCCVQNGILHGTRPHRRCPSLVVHDIRCGKTPLVSQESAAFHTWNVHVQLWETDRW